ncbi:hypothetical protein LQ938_12440 [Microbacterium sp. cx-55]|uniref:hypothetical protein n=1 Tax=Microbacterium sp. cx-55 TaxID=2875948 RepID=UPI001CBC62EE|nr:hypothetical protein [Microbacterium sp. cx-55]MBZ4487924.1 hypothetical protein [Microbacterium sp. cx-55]UGB34665.1 hypothetical protein LQ938_12440 [Microbacterium sp. cx-55]
MTRQRVLAAPLALAALIALAGCAVPDPALVKSEAEAVFEDLVSHAGETDAAILRSLETSPPADQACTGDDEGTVTSYTATGTLSITAHEAEAAGILDALGDTLDPEEWTPIRPAASEQSAWISEHDVVVTLTPEGPAFVVAVFTPCLTE